MRTVGLGLGDHLCCRIRATIGDAPVRTCKQRADAPLCQGRRVTLDKVETITAFAKDMSEYLKTSEPTESRVFIRSSIKEIEVRQGKATIHYSIPTEDSPLEGADAAEVVLNVGVMSTGRWWGRGDSNPHAFQHMILNHARLPIPTLPHGTARGLCPLIILDRHRLLTTRTDTARGPRTTS